MTELPSPGTNTLGGGTREETFIHALFLAGVADDYARVVRKLISDITGREDPYRGGNAETLLAIAGARDVIEHVDEYMFANGRMREHWFDLTSRFGPGEYQLRVSGELDIDMIDLARNTDDLARVVDQTVVVWIDIERKLDLIEEFAAPLLEAGISVTARFDSSNGDLDDRSI